MKTAFPELERLTPPRNQWGWLKLPWPSGKPQEDPRDGVRRTYGQYQRISTLCKTLSSQDNLIRWQGRVVAKGLTERGGAPLLKQIKLLDVKADRAEFNAICDKAKILGGGEEGADDGTFLHSITHQLDALRHRLRMVSGSAPSDAYDEASQAIQDWYHNVCPADSRGDVTAYERAMDLAGIEVPSFGIERTVGNTKLMAGGTYDAQLFHRDWALPRIGDKKSGQALEYIITDTCIQVAAYATADILCPPIWDITRLHMQYQEMPKVDQTRGVLIWFPAGRAECTLIELDLEVGAQAAEWAAKVRDWRTWSKGGKNLSSIMQAAVVGEISTSARLVDNGAFTGTQPDPFAEAIKGSLLKAADDLTDAELSQTVIAAVLDTALDPAAEFLAEAQPPTITKPRQRAATGPKPGNAAEAARKARHDALHAMVSRSASTEHLIVHRDQNEDLWGACCDERAGARWSYLEAGGDPETA